MIFQTEKGALYGKDFTKKVECPFCGLPVERPTEPLARRYGEMPAGSCRCGAVFACDITGRNLGAAFIEALVFGCDMDWDLAWSLRPGEDYTDRLVEKYDLKSHLIVPAGSYDGRRVSGALYFIRLHREIRDVTGNGVQNKLGRARGAAAPGQAPEHVSAIKMDKKEIRRLAAEYRVEPLMAAAGVDKRIVRDLQRLLYSEDDLTRHRAADILGQVSAAIAKREPGAISTLLQGLLNSIAAPGAASWGSIEAMGEIIAQTPDLYAGYLPLLYTFLGDRDHRPRILRAAARIARVRPDLLRGAAFRLIKFLNDPDPGVRGWAALLSGYLGMAEAKKDLEKITGDSGRIIIYNNGEFEETTVGRLAAEALEKIKQPIPHKECRISRPATGTNPPEGP